MPLIWQLPWANIMLTMMYLEMLFVVHIHQPIVASLAVRVDDTVKGHLAPDRTL